MRGLQERGTVPPLRPAPVRPTGWSAGRLALSLLVVTAVIVADQLSKSLEQTALASGPTHVLGPLDLELTYNSGAAFGVGRGLAPLIVIVGVALVVLIFGIGRPVHGRLASAGGGLLLGGAVSNLGDRLFRGHGGAVIDWIHLSHWPTFNVADSCIVFGVALLVLANLRHAA